MPEKGHEKVGTWIVLIASIIPALITSGFMPDWNVLGMGVWMLIAALGSAVGGAIYGGKRLWLLGSLCGAVIGAGIVGAQWVYFKVIFADRTEFRKIEMALVALVGAVPGFLLYLFGLRGKAAEERFTQPPSTPENQPGKPEL